MENKPSPGGGKKNGKNEKVGKINKNRHFSKGKQKKYLGKKYDFQKKGGGEIK